MYGLCISYTFYTKFCCNFFLGMIKTYFFFTKKLLQKYSIKIYSIKERLLDFKCFPLLLNSKNLMKWKMKIELHRNDQMKIIMSIIIMIMSITIIMSIIMLGTWDAWDVVCLG